MGRVAIISIWVTLIRVHSGTHASQVYTRDVKVGVTREVFLIHDWLMVQRAFVQTRRGVAMIRGLYEISKGCIFHKLRSDQN